MASGRPTVTTLLKAIDQNFTEALSNAEMRLKALNEINLTKINTELTQLTSQIDKMKPRAPGSIISRGLFVAGTLLPINKVRTLMRDALRDAEELAETVGDARFAELGKQFEEYNRLLGAGLLEIKKWGMEIAGSITKALQDAAIQMLGLQEFASTGVKEFLDNPENAAMVKQLEATEERLEDNLRTVSKLIEAAKSDGERYAETLKMINELEERNRITAEEAARARRAAFEAATKEANKLAEQERKEIERTLKTYEEARDKIRLPDDEQRFRAVAEDIEAGSRLRESLAGTTADARAEAAERARLLREAEEKFVLKPRRDDILDEIEDVEAKREKLRERARERAAKFAKLTPELADFSSQLVGIGQLASGLQSGLLSRKRDRDAEKIEEQKKALMAEHAKDRAEFMKATAELRGLRTDLSKVRSRFGP